MPSLADVVDVVDDCDQVIGQTKRGELGGHNFRTAHVFLFNRQRQLVLGQLGSVRTKQPGAWGSSVAAHVLAGESYRSAASRRLREELGVDPALRLCCTLAVPEGSASKFVSLFIGEVDEVENREPDHVAALRFADIDAVRAEVDDSPDRFTATFRYLWHTYLELAAAES